MMKTWLHRLDLFNCFQCLIVFSWHLLLEVDVFKCNFLNFDILETFWYIILKVSEFVVSEHWLQHYSYICLTAFFPGQPG